jgi:hypothetical protein
MLDCLFQPEFVLSCPKAVLWPKTLSDYFFVQCNVVDNCNCRHHVKILFFFTFFYFLNSISHLFIDLCFTYNNVRLTTKHSTCNKHSLFCDSTLLNMPFVFSFHSGIISAMQERWSRLEFMSASCHSKSHTADETWLVLKIHSYKFCTTNSLKKKVTWITFTDPDPTTQCANPLLVTKTFS